MAVETCETGEHPRRREFLTCAAHLTAALSVGARLGWTKRAAPRPPNILYLLCDDLGYGDVHCLNPQRGKIATPNIDRVASQGMIFSDAHSGSAVCTPARYGVLTGRYAWRSSLQSGVLYGYSPPLIAPQRTTVASLLRRNGYRTALIGKWHLGWGWSNLDSRPRKAHSVQVTEEQLGHRLGDILTESAQQELDGIDYGKAIQGGPSSLGFDYFYGLTAPDFAPFVWIENDRVTTPPTEIKRVIRLGIGQHEYEPERILPDLTRRASEYIRREAAKPAQPFFLEFTLTSPHSPLLPTREWRGRSGLGLYADWVMQTDAAIGEVLKALDQAGAADNTLVIITSDNGCAPYIGVRDEYGEDVRGHMRPTTAVRELEEAGHFPSAGYRGYKSDTWDGGHRVPFLVRWPGKVRPGSSSGQLVCLTDLMTTCAAILNTGLPADAGEDSISFLPALSGTTAPRMREAIVHHSGSGKFAIRQGKWKLLLGPGSGGWSQPTDVVAAREGLAPVQLFNMAADPGEQSNVQGDHTGIVRRLISLLESYVKNGRSTPGRAQKNDVPVDIWKGTVYKR